MQFFNLGKDQNLILHGDYVNLASLAGEVAFDNALAMGTKIVGGNFLPLVSGAFAYVFCFGGQMSSLFLFDCMLK